MLWAQLLPLLWAGSLATENYELSLTNSVTVQEGLCVFVPCQVKYPASRGSVFGYWFRAGANTNLDSPVATNDPHRPVQQETQGRFYLVGGIDTNNCSLDIRDARKSDTGKYFFRLDGSVKYSFQQPMLSVRVKALTKTPNLQVTPTLLSGTSTRVICSVPWACEQGTPPIFSWMSSALTSLGRRTILSSELNLTPRPQDNGSNLICQVTFPGAGVTVERTQQLSVIYAPQKLTIRVSWGDGTETKVLQSGASLQIQEGESLRLVCVVDSNPSAMLSWKRQTQKNFPLSKGDELQLPRVELEDQGKYICQAENILGTQEASVSLSIRSLLQLLAPSCSWDSEGLHCSCSSRAWPAPSLHWRLGEGLLEGNSSNSSFKVTSSSLGPWVNSSLSLLQELRPSLWLSCEAWNTHGAQTISVLLLPDKDSSAAFSKGAALGFGITALLALCLVVIIMKTLQKKGTQEETSRPKISRGSTILDYINVVPKTRSPARNWKAEPDTPSGISPLDTHSPKPKKKQKDPRFTSPGFPDPRPSSQAPVPENNPEELHYAALNFPRLRLRETQNPQDTYSDYAEVRVH